jgi:hypothetical protein
MNDNDQQGGDPDAMITSFHVPSFSRALLHLNFLRWKTFRKLELNNVGYERLVRRLGGGLRFDNRKVRILRLRVVKITDSTLF